MKTKLKSMSSEESKIIQKEGFSFLGRPVSVKVEGKKSVRLNQPAVVTIAIPKSQLASIDSSDDVYAASSNQARFWNKRGSLFCKRCRKKFF